MLFLKYYSGDYIEKIEIGKLCSNYVGEERRIHRFWWGDLKERDYLGDGGVDGRIILRSIFMKWDVGDWNGLTLAQEVVGLGECGN